MATIAQLGLQPITPTIGSYVNDVDLSGPLGGDMVTALRYALHERAVLVFKDQPAMTPELLKRFGEQFGPLWMHPFGTQHPAHPEVMLFNESTANRLIGWHVDATFEEKPIYGSILRAVELPANGGGDTLWASAAAAYDALTPPMKAFVDPLNAIHKVTVLHDEVSREYSVGAESAPSATHPVVLTDWLTGRRHLFVNPLYTTRIVELSQAESDALLAFLYGHITSPNFQMRLKWEPGMVVFWNNLMTHHYATDDYRGSRRLVERVTVGGAPDNITSGT